MKRQPKTRRVLLLTSCSLAVLAFAAVPVAVDFSIDDGIVVAAQKAYARGGGEGGGNDSGGEHGGNDRDDSRGGGGHSRDDGGEHSRDFGRDDSRDNGGERGGRGVDSGEHGAFGFLFRRSGDDDGTPDQGRGDN